MPRWSRCDFSFPLWFPNFANVVLESMPTQVTSATTHHSNTRPWTISSRNPPPARSERTDSRSHPGELMSGSRVHRLAGFLRKELRHNTLCFNLRAMNSWWMRSDQDWIRAGPSYISLAFGNGQLIFKPGWFLLSPLMGRYLSQSTPSPLLHMWSRPCQSEPCTPIVIGSEMNMWQLTANQRSEWFQVFCWLYWENMI